MSTVKNNKNNKREIINITMLQFEQMAADAAEKNGMSIIDELHTSINRFKNKDEEITQTLFAVHYRVGNETYYGQSTHPQIAIDQAIAQRRVDAGTLVINAQAKIEHNETEQTGKE